MNTNLQYFTETIENWPDRQGTRPQSHKPTPNMQLDQFPTSDKYAKALFTTAKNLLGVSVGKSTIGDSDRSAFFIDTNQERGFNKYHLIHNEFAHIHEHESFSLHMALPENIGNILEAKGYAEKHPLAKIGRIPTTNFLIYGAGNELELELQTLLLNISYQYATKRLEDK